MVKFYFNWRLVIKRGLELMASIIDSTSQKEEAWVWIPMLASSLQQVLWMRDLVWHFLSKICEWMEVGISSNVKFFKLYPRGGEAKCRGKIGAFRYVRSQSAAEIYLAPDSTGGVHNAWVMRRKKKGVIIVNMYNLQLCQPLTFHFSLERKQRQEVE